MSVAKKPESKKGYGRAASVIMSIAIVFVGISLVGGYLSLFQQRSDLRKALEGETQARLYADDKVIELKKALADLKDSKTLVKDARQDDLSPMVNPNTSVPRGRGYIFVCTVRGDKWNGLTLDRGTLRSPEEFSEKSVKVSDSVYIRKTLPNVLNGPRGIGLKLGEIIGVVRRGQSVKIGKVFQPKPGSWYAEVNEVTGEPSGDKSLGSGFFKAGQVPGPAGFDLAGAGAQE